MRLVELFPFGVFPDTEFLVPNSLMVPELYGFAEEIKHKLSRLLEIVYSGYCWVPVMPLRYPV